MTGVQRCSEGSLRAFVEHVATKPATSQECEGEMEEEIMQRFLLPTSAAPRAGRPWLLSQPGIKETSVPSQELDRTAKSRHRSVFLAAGGLRVGRGGLLKDGSIPERWQCNNSSP